jgi:hypothetical protein
MEIHMVLKVDGTGEFFVTNITGMVTVQSLMLRKETRSNHFIAQATLHISVVEFDMLCYISMFP